MVGGGGGGVVQKQPGSAIIKRAPFFESLSGAWVLSGGRLLAFHSCRLQCACVDTIWRALASFLFPALLGANSLRPNISTFKLRLNSGLVVFIRRTSERGPDGETRFSKAAAATLTY